ncbi:MAG: hypothetical protein HC880_08775, partial [Bacteroidia bacterium]|nr:hypothetical protein [Bacteroidia bacterium]
MFSRLIEVNSDLFNLVGNFEEDKSLKESYQLVFGERKYFPDQAFSEILKLRSFIDKIRSENEFLADVLTVAVISCLISVSLLKKAGDVRFKTKKELEKELKNIQEVLPKKIAEISEDIMNFDYKLNTSPEFLLANTKNIGKINDLEIGAIITSPPYLNGTNYFRNTKLELWFLRYLQYESDLRLFRDQALTSGINDVRKEYQKSNGLDISTKSKILQSTLLALHQNAYDSRIPIMAKSYFEEMYSLFAEIRKFLKKDALILIDIGDSIFSNIHIKTDLILIELLQNLGFEIIENKLLRKRRSRNQAVLSQTLMVLKYNQASQDLVEPIRFPRWQDQWEKFKIEVPHQKAPYSKRNWGHSNHSLCSYQGKLKPSIAYHLVETFVPSEGSVLDLFSGVGTIPFEAALNNKRSYGIDLSVPAYYISSAKVSLPSKSEAFDYMSGLDRYLTEENCHEQELQEVQLFGFNKKLNNYYQDQTLREILLARRYIKINYPKTPTEMLVVASLLHILHGNRPYALSRRSHPIVPYAPSGDFQYRNLIKNLTDKVNRVLTAELPLNFKPGKIFNQDST